MEKNIILLKISGTEIEDGDFTKIVEAIKCGVRQNKQFMLIIDEDSPYIKNEFKNVLGDIEIVENLQAVASEEVSELIFFEKTGGILDNNGDIVSFLGNERTKKVLSNKDKKVSAGGDVENKLAEIYAMLEQVPKIAIVNAQSLDGELSTALGKGTLVMNIDNSEMEKMSPEEACVFDEVYAEYVEIGNWKEIDAEELNNLKENHYLIKKEGTILGGFSAFSNQDGWTEIKKIWSQYQGNGIGKVIMDHVKKSYKKTYLFCAEKNQDGQKFFCENGFEKQYGYMSSGDMPYHVMKAKKESSKGASLMMHDGTKLKFLGKEIYTPIIQL